MIPPHPCAVTDYSICLPSLPYSLSSSTCTPLMYQLFLKMFKFWPGMSGCHCARPVALLSKSDTFPSNGLLHGRPSGRLSPCLLWLSDISSLRRLWWLTDPLFSASLAFGFVGRRIFIPLRTFVKTQAGLFTAQRFVRNTDSCRLVDPLSVGQNKTLF